MKLPSDDASGQLLGRAATAGGGGLAAAARDCARGDAHAADEGRGSSDESRSRQRRGPKGAVQRACVLAPSIGFGPQKRCEAVLSSHVMMCARVRRLPASRCRMSVSLSVHVLQRPRAATVGSHVPHVWAVRGCALSAPLALPAFQSLDGTGEWGLCLSICTSLLSVQYS